MTHRARLAGLWVAVLWSTAVGIGAGCLLYTRQYDALILASVVLLITMILLLVYLWDTVRALGFKENDTKRYKSEVDFLTGKVGDLEYQRRTMYGVFKAVGGSQRGELISLHEVLFAAKAETRTLNQEQGKLTQRPGALITRDRRGRLEGTADDMYNVYAVRISIKGDVA